MKREIFATFRVVAVLFFRFLGFMVFSCSTKRKPITKKNINLCFPIKNKKDEKRNNKIARDSFITLGHAFADFLLMRFYNKKNIDDYFTLKGLDNFYKAQEKQKGVIFSTAHFGNSELAAHCFALKMFKSLILYNPIKKPLWLERFVKNNREISGNVLIAKQNSFFSVYKTLKKKGVVGFLTDQNCTPRDGRKVPLFGHNVWTHTAFIKLSLKTGAPIVPGFSFIKKLSKYEIEFFPPLFPEDFKKYDDPEYEMALEINRILENVIYKSPDQWMWQHRRFKNILD